MLIEERRKQLLDLVSRRGFISLADLARELRVSEATARRDLNYWRDYGVLKRIHGGAMYTGENATLPSLEERAHSQTSEKIRVARVAASRIRNGDTVLLDGGTTTLEVARFLAGRPVQVVTNSLPIATLLSSTRETQLVFLGGSLYPSAGVVLGPLTIRALENIHVHQTILSVAGITAKGLFNSNMLLVETERRMMRCAEEVVVVADHTKIGRHGLAFLCKLSTIDTLIVDDGLTPEQRQLVDGVHT